MLPLQAVRRTVGFTDRPDHLFQRRSRPAHHRSPLVIKPKASSPLAVATEMHTWSEQAGKEHFRCQMEVKEKGSECEKSKIPYKMLCNKTLRTSNAVS